jgi:hypothetical protein
LTGVTRRGRCRRVGAIHEVWRVDDAWWRTPLARRHHAADLQGGAAPMIFCHLTTGA